MACALTKATSRRRLQRWQPIRPDVAATSLRRLLSCGNVSGSCGPISLAWRLGGDSSLRDVSWRLAGSPGSREKFKHVRFFLETFSSLQQVSETSPRPAGDVAATSPQSPWSPSGLGDVAETSPIPAGDWKKSPPQKNRTCFNFPRLPGDPASLQETSRRRRGEVSATSGDSSRQLVAT